MCQNECYHFLVSNSNLSLKHPKKIFIFWANCNKLFLTDQTITVLVHFSEQLLSLVDVATLCSHHFIHSRNNPEIHRLLLYIRQKKLTLLVLGRADFINWGDPLPLHFIEIDTSISIHIIHSECPSKFFLWSTIWCSMKSKHELSS